MHLDFKPLPGVKRYLNIQVYIFLYNVTYICFSKVSHYHSMFPEQWTRNITFHSSLIWHYWVLNRETGAILTQKLLQIIKGIFVPQSLLFIHHIKHIRTNSQIRSVALGWMAMKWRDYLNEATFPICSSDIWETLHVAVPAIKFRWLKH